MKLLISGRATVALLALSFLIGRSVAGEWNVEITPKPADNFQRAALRLWIDDALRQPRALLVLLPGWNGDGRGMASDPTWRDWARKHQLGIVAAFFRTEDGKVPYDLVERGSGEAFLKGLRELGRQSGRISLSQAPLLVWGHSAGGQFAYGFACFRPERVIAFAALKGGRYQSRFDPRVRTVPALWVVGERDLPYRATAITTLFEAHRAAGAPWCLAFEPDAGHEVGRTRELVEPFFEAALTLRLGSNGGGRPLSPAHADWIGHRATLETTRDKTRHGSKRDLARTVWLPDEASALAWKKLSAARGDP